MSISLGDAILFLSADDTKLKRTLKSAETAYDKYEKATGRAITRSMRMQAGDWFMIDKAANKSFASMRNATKSMRDYSQKAQDSAASSNLMTLAFTRLGVVSKSWTGLATKAGLWGILIGLGSSFVKAAAATDSWNYSMDRLGKKIPILESINYVMDLLAKKSGAVAKALMDISDRADYGANLKEAERKEKEAKSRNKAAQDQYDLRHAGDINRGLVRENPGAAEARAKAEQLMKAQQGMGILGGMGGATQQEQKALWEADQILQREARRAARGGTRNIAMEQEVARRKGVIMQRIANRNKGVGDAMQAVQDESGGDPNKAQEIMAGFTDWYSGMVKAGSRQVGTAAQVINQYITVSHANIAMSEQQKAAYNMKRSMMPGVP